MTNTDLMQAIGQIDEAYISEAKDSAVPRRRRLLSTKTSRFAAAVAALFAISIIIPNTGADAADTMGNIPVIGTYFKAITFRSYSYDDGKHAADIEQPQIEYVAGADDSVVAQDTAKEVNENIDRYIQTAISDFKKQAKKQGYEAIDIHYEVLGESERYFQLQLTCTESAADTVEHERIYVIDKTTGKTQTLKDIYADDSPDAPYLAGISDEIKRQMRAQMAADENVSYWIDSDMPDMDFQTITNDAQFYIEDDGDGGYNLVICFDEGEVAPMYMGVCRFTIAQEVWQSFLRHQPMGR